MNQSHTRRRCPKCGGNLFLFNDFNGWYEECLQCSYTLYLDLVYQGKKEPALKRTSSGSPND